MADWAEGFDGSSVRANVKSWNILDIPAYENYLTIYWNNAYELGGCALTRYDVVAQNRNAKSKNYNVHYICKATGWQKATDCEKDTYQFGAGNDGEVRTGKVNEDKYYVYENGAWRASASEIENNLGACVSIRESEKHQLNGKYYICENKVWKEIPATEYGLGYCTTAKNGTVEKLNDVYYICKSEKWNVATVLEYDTYGWEDGTEGAVKPGSVNTSNHYVFENGVWRASKNDMEYNYGACVTIRESEKHQLNGKYYICENKAWKEIPATEYGLGYCTTAKNGAVEKLNDVYYICKSEKWNVATALEYDTYGKNCGMDGTIVSGEVSLSNKYVCDAGAFRVANEQEISLNKGCVNYTENDEIIRLISSTTDSIYTCKKGVWQGSEIIVPEGYLLDRRDKKMYKIVTIGTQTWMAENLNYSDSINYPSMLERNWCYKNKLDSCSKYGRLYTWAAAMDSVGTFSTNGKGCGYGKTCSPIYPVRGICPEGWHLPTREEFETLFTAVGGSSTAGTMLKSTSGWDDYNGKSGNGTDAFGFSALPAGLRYEESGIHVGTYAYFWSVIENYGSSAYLLRLNYYDEIAHIQGGINKSRASSVRCLRD